MFDRIDTKRLILNIIIVILFLAIFVRLVKLQIVMGNDYRNQAENRLVSTETIFKPES